MGIILHNIDKINYPRELYKKHLLPEYGINPSSLWYFSWTVKIYNM